MVERCIYRDIYLHKEVAVVVAKLGSPRPEEGGASGQPPARRSVALGVTAALLENMPRGGGWAVEMLLILEMRGRGQVSPLFFLVVCLLRRSAQLVTQTYFQIFFCPCLFASPTLRPGSVASLLLFFSVVVPSAIPFDQGLTAFAPCSYPDAALVRPWFATRTHAKS